MHMVSRFRRIEIKGLFGDRDEVIEFPDIDDPVRILYGVNGSGKTTILKIIQHAYRWNPIELMKLPFESITFHKNTRGKLDLETFFQVDGELGLNGNTDIIDLIEKEIEGDSIANAITKLEQKFEILDRKYQKNQRKISEFAQLLETMNATMKKYQQPKGLKQFYSTKYKLHYKQSTKVQKTPQKKMKIQWNLKSVKEKEQEALESREAVIKSARNKEEAERLLIYIAAILKKKFLELVASGQTNYPEWGDGLSLYLDKDGYVDTCTNMDARFHREFDSDSSLKIERILNPSQEIYNQDEEQTMMINCGSYLKITQEIEPQIKFENKQIETVLKILDGLNKISSQRHYMFGEIFSSKDSTWKIRMPDIFDYWDADWNLIEKEMSGYQITRSYSSRNINRSNLDTYIEIKSPSGEKIEVEDFLRKHIPARLVTHSKRRKGGGVDKQFSIINRPPDSVSDFFDYNIVKLDDPEDAELFEYYVHLPEVVNISTDRDLGGKYFNSVSSYVQREWRICKRTIEDNRKAVEDFEKINTTQKELIETRLRERGIDINKFLKGIPLKLEDRFREIKGAEIINHLDTLIRTPDEDSNPRKTKMDYLFGHFSPNATEYTLDDLNFKPIVEIVDSLVNILELEMVLGLIKQYFPNIDIDLFNNSISSNGEDLNFGDLSSGERQRFTIFTNIGMQIIGSKNSLITIDEPELSLHLSWQRQFIDDITSFISELTSKYRVKISDSDELEQVVSLIVSTHAPAILANHYHRGQKIGESDFDDE